MQKNPLRTFSHNWVLALVASVLLFSCSQMSEEVAEFLPESEFTLRSSSNGPIGTITTITGGKGGNAECSDSPASLDSTSGRINFNNGSFDGVWPEGFTVSVSERKFVTWSYDGDLCLEGVSVIVKGGPASNIFTYGPGITGDKGLFAPLNGGKKTPDLSNLTICYSTVECKVEKPCYQSETAWTSGTPFNEDGKGNWGMYSTYAANATVDIMAGQHYKIGTVTFGPQASNGKVVLSFDFTDGQLRDVAENIKISGFNEAPTGNQANGQANLFKGSRTAKSFTLEVDKATYYGIHLDAERIVACK